MPLRLAIVLLLALVGLSAPALAQSAPSFETKATSAILIDAKSGAVFFEKNADELVPPASMSKLMTMVMVFEALKKGSLTLDQEFLVSTDAWRRGGSSSGGSTMYAEVNSRVKLDDLIHGVIIQSANDASIAVAEGMAGSESAFADRMTARARELGLTRSTFRNATGLPDPEHRMTDRELSMVARYIITNFPEEYKIYGKPSFTWNKITQSNRNPLLTDYPGADGMKTGYTKEAGYGLVGSAIRDGRRLIMVIAGLKTINERRQEAQKLLDWGFRQFKTLNVFAANDTVGRARVWGGEEWWVNLVTRQDVRVLLSPKEQEKIEVKLRYDGPLMAPVSRGTKVGMLRFEVDGAVVSESPVETAAPVAAVESMWSKALDSLMLLAFGS